MNFEPEREIPNLGFALKVDVRKQRIPGQGGGLHFISGFMPQTLRQEIERALCDKVPKLAAADASLRVLLLEQDNPPYTPWQIAGKLATVSAEVAPSLPGLSAIDSIWLADTREKHTRIWVCKIWPDGVGAAFVVKGSLPDAGLVVTTS